MLYTDKRYMYIYIYTCTLVGPDKKLVNTLYLNNVLFVFSKHITQSRGKPTSAGVDLKLSVDVGFVDQRVKHIQH